MSEKVTGSIYGRTEIGVILKISQSGSLAFPRCEQLSELPIGTSVEVEYTTINLQKAVPDLQVVACTIILQAAQV